MTKAETERLAEAEAFSSSPLKQYAVVYRYESEAMAEHVQRCQGRGDLIPGHESAYFLKVGGLTAKEAVDLGESTLAVSMNWDLQGECWGK